MHICVLFKVLFHSYLVMELVLLLHLTRGSMKQMVQYIISHSMKGTFLTIVHVYYIIIFIHMYIHTAVCRYIYSLLMLIIPVDTVYYCMAKNCQLKFNKTSIYIEL